MYQDRVPFVTHPVYFVAWLITRVLKIRRPGRWSQLIQRVGVVLQKGVKVFGKDGSTKGRKDVVEIRSI